MKYMEGFNAPKIDKQAEGVTFENKGIETAVTGVGNKADLLAAIRVIGYEDHHAKTLAMPKEERPTEGVSNISDKDWQSLCKLWDSLPGSW